MTRKRTSTTLVVLQQTADIAGAGDAAIKTAGTTKMTSTNGHVRNAILALMAAFFLRDVIKYLGRVVLFRFLLGRSTRSGRPHYESGAQSFAAVLHAYNVRIAFATQGVDRTKHLVDKLRAANIHVIDTVRDWDAVFAADAYFRLTGQIALAVIDYPNGVLNSVAAIQNALRAESGVLVVTVGSQRLDMNNGLEQTIDAAVLMRKQAKAAFSITNVRSISGVVIDAIKTCANDVVPGPCYIELAWEMGQLETAVRAKYNAACSDSSSWYSFIYRYRLDSAFATNTALALTEGRHHHGSEKLYISQVAVDRTLAALKRAAHPLIIVGSQAMLENAKLTQLQEALQRIHVPVVTLERAVGLLNTEDSTVPVVQFPEHLAGVGHDADCIVLLGVAHDYRIQYLDWANSQAVVISANRCKTQVSLNRSPTLSIITHPAAFAIALAERVKGSELVRTDWMDEVESARPRMLSPEAFASPTSSNQRRLWLALGETIPSNAFVAVDDKWVGSFGSHVLRLTNSHFRHLEAGPIGASDRHLGFAIASKAANPANPVWIILSPADTDANILVTLKTLQSLGGPAVLLIVSSAAAGSSSDAAPSVAIDWTSELFLSKKLRVSALRQSVLVSELAQVARNVSCSIVEVALE